MVQVERSCDLFIQHVFNRLNIHIMNLIHLYFKPSHTFAHLGGLQKEQMTEGLNSDLNRT